MLDEQFLAFLAALMAWIIARIEIMSRKLGKMEAQVEILYRIVLNNRENRDKKKRS